MSPQDAQLLQDFLNQLVQARGLPKDPEAEAMIQQAVAHQPDAAYLLVQRALLQQQALDNARAEISALQQQVQQQAQQLRGGSQGGFLDPHAWGNGGAGRAQAHGGAIGQPYPPQYRSDTPSHYNAGYPQAPVSSRLSNFFRGGGMGRGFGGGMGGALGSIASTAAGVAAGAFLFQGLGNLLGNHGGNGFLGSNEGFDSLASNFDDGNAGAALAGDGSATPDSLVGGDGDGGGLSDDLGLDDIGGDFGDSGDSLG